MFCEKGVLRHFTKFTGKHLCQSLLFNKVANYIRKEALAQLFSCEFCEIFKNTFSYRTAVVAAPVFSSVSRHPEILNFQKYLKKVPKLTQVDPLSPPIRPLAKTSKMFKLKKL